MKLSFYGAAGEVTGSCTLLEADRARVLIDFGLHQGGPEAEAHNRRFPPLDPRRLDCVVLTHAHLDHSGRLPLLVREGFAGPIWATPATIDLCGILLADSAHLQEADSERQSRRHPAEGMAAITPLYALKDVEGVLKLMRPIRYAEDREVAPGVTIRMMDAGHILGSASVSVMVRAGGGERTIVFSGDIGVRGAPLLRDPTPPDHADVLVLESTYGDRDHRPLAATLEEFARVLGAARAEKGKVLMPAFAVGRTQQLIYHVGRLKRDGRLDHTPVYIDSPMAIAATELYRRHRELFDEEAWALIHAGDSPLNFPDLHFARTSEESRRLNEVDSGIVVIAASGMCTGGRILHHLRHGLWRPGTHVIIAGFQAVGTLGRALVDGAKQVSIMGERVTVKAAIHTLGGFSAHAGQGELIGWARAIGGSRPRVLLNHGEPPAREALRVRLKSELGMEAERPVFGQVFDLG